MLHTCVVFTVLLPAEAARNLGPAPPPLSCPLPSGAYVVVLGARAPRPPHAQRNACLRCGVTERTRGASPRAAMSGLLRMLPRCAACA